MKPKPLLILLAALAVAAGFAIRATTTIADANAALAVLAVQRAGFLRKTAALEKRFRMANEAIAAVERNEAALAKNSAAASNTAGPAGDQVSDKPATVARKLSPASVVASDPKKMAEYTKNYRASLDLTLGGMFKALGLSPEQIEKVKDVRVWHEQTVMDMQAAAEAQGLNLAGKAYLKMRWDDLGDERRKKETEILGGGELLERYRDFRQNYYLRDTVQRIASAEMGAETPATFAQVERATAILQANSLRPATDPKRQWMWQQVGWSWQDWAAINWAVAEPQLQRELSPGQFAVLRQFLRTQETWTAVAKRNAANQTEATRLTRQPGG